MASLADDRHNQEDQLLQREEQTLLAARVQQALGRLNERERRIVRDRILSDHPLTLQELAEVYGISRERIRQLEKNALEKLKGMLANGVDKFRRIP